MAKKKSASAAPKASAPKKKGASVKKTAVKKSAAAPKKSAPKKGAAPKKSAASAAKKASPKKKAAAAVKLNPAQADLLKKVHGAGEGGYPGDKKAEQRTLEALRTRKLVKKGPKNKESGHFHYHSTASGKKHAESAPAASAPAASSTEGTSTPAAS